MTAAHLDYDALADFAEGILDEATATSAEEHLAHCDDCRRRAAEVAEVSRVLARAPTPPMPADLVARLDAALAAEAAARPAARRSHRRFQFLAAAAAAVVVVGGGAAALRTVVDHGDSASAPSAEPPAADRSVAPPNPDAVPAVPFTALRSGTRYTSAGLASQVAGALAKPGAIRPRALDAPAGTLGQCVARVSDGRAPLLVDSATFEGRPATVIVLPALDAGHVNVWVVGDKCSASDSDVITMRPIPR